MYRQKINYFIMKTRWRMARERTLREDMKMPEKKKCGFIRHAWNDIDGYVKMGRWEDLWFEEMKGGKGGNIWRCEHVMRFRCEEPKIWQNENGETSKKQQDFYTEWFTQEGFYTKTLFRTDPFTHRPFFTHSHSHTQILFHTDACTHRPSETQMLLHREAFTHRRIYT